MKIYNDVTELIGNTPVLRLNRLTQKSDADVFIKLEMYNPGGSVKDRIGYSMIRDAEEKGLIKPGDTLVEPTSGNTGIGLAMVAAARGYKLVLTMSESMSLERRKLLKAYGAQIVFTPAEKGMQGAIDKAEELVRENGYYMPQQFKNLANPQIHRETTALEIIDAFDGKLDAFVAGVGSGGTITGTGEVLKEKIPDIKIYAVEPHDSAVLSGGRPGPNMIQGLGAGFVPDILNTSIYDEIYRVKNEDAFETTRALAREEGILLGISCGAAVYAALKVSHKLGSGKRVLAIAPDTGERYLSMNLFDA